MQLSGTVLRAIEQVLQESERKPADAALRLVLRSSGLSAGQKRLVSRAVFTYHRWLGWLERDRPFRIQLEHAFELDASLAKIPDGELSARALPAWVPGAMETSPALLRELQAEPKLWLRARPGSAAGLAAALGHCVIHPTVPDALWYRGTEDLFQTPEFRAGEFEIQDLSSQIVGHLCGPQPGETWWDACAGEGGKTLHLCDLMRNKGLVWASDTALWRLDTLKRRASRAKIFNYRIKPWTHADQIPTKTKFDGILVDAPCSGIGTWGRNPHARWTTQPSDVEELAALQESILTRVADSLKPGGTLVYSVCTLTQLETSQVADKFEASHPTLQRLSFAVPGSSERSDRVVIRPEEWHSVGMFVAGWQRAE